VLSVHIKILGSRVRDFQEGKRNFTEGRRGTRNLGGFQDEKSHKRILHRILQRVHKLFENHLSI
jgi:hypothetical protein